MRIGTKSLLFGVHQFAWHPLTVFWAWRKLYGSWPNWWQCIAIVTHDWGYWGKPNMDGEEGRLHPYGGAKIAARIASAIFRFTHLRASYLERIMFELEVYFFTLWHSRELAKRNEVKPSALCWADKYCVCVEPKWFYLLRARLSGEIDEYIENACPVIGDIFAENMEIFRHDKALQLNEEFWLGWYQRKVMNLPEVKKYL